MNIENNKRQKTGGREKGTPNKITKDIREVFQSLIENNLETLDNDLKSLEPKERLEIIIKLGDFVIPKLQKSVIKDERQNMLEDLIIKGIVIEK